MDTPQPAAAKTAPKIESVPIICVMGKGGVGKTRLASLYKNAFVIDIEGGAGSAFKPEYRKRIDLDQGTNSVERVIQAMREINALPYRERNLWRGEQPIGAVVIDAIDSLQQVVKYAYLSKKTLPQWAINKGMMSVKMEQNDWGQLLDIMMPLVMEFKKMKVPVIVISHVDEEKPQFQGENLIKSGFADFAAQGALRTNMENWFDYILHILAVPAGEEKVQRVVYTQRFQHEGIVYNAKDRHNVFAQAGKSAFNIDEDPDRPGFPKSRCMQLIYDSHEY